ARKRRIGGAHKSLESGRRTYRERGRPPDHRYPHCEIIDWGSCQPVEARSDPRQKIGVAAPIGHLWIPGLGRCSDQRDRNLSGQIEKFLWKKPRRDKAERITRT